MGRAWVGGAAARQAALLPVDAGDLLPADHVVWDLLAVGEELDLADFEAVYRADGRGRPPFSPRVLLTLILYCRSKGLLSGRQVAAACHDDLGARLITGNRYPDRSTIDRFIGRHAAAIKGLLPQTLRLGHAAGLVDVSVVAGDGSKLAASAAMSATVDEAALLAQVGELQQRLAAAQAEWAELAGIEGEDRATLFDDLDAAASTPAGTTPAPGTDTGAWRRVRTLAAMLHRRQSALAWLRAHPGNEQTDWQQRRQRAQQRLRDAAEHLDHTLTQVQAVHARRAEAAAAGRKLPGTAPASVEQDSRVRRARTSLAKATAHAQSIAAANPGAGRVNTTDPASAIMPSKHGGYDQNHNIQALAGKGQFILAIGTHPSSTDTQALHGLIRDARANLDTAAITDRIGVALFDSGYASEANFTTDLPVNLLLVAVGKQTGHTDHTTPAIPAAWQPMAERLATPDNRSLYKRRAAIIEPLFAQLFTTFDRTIPARGTNVDTELHLWATTHNLLKIRRHHQRKPGSS